MSIMGQNLATSQSEFDAAYLAAQPQQVQALMQMPYGEVALLVESIKQQLQQQNNKEDGNVSIAP